MNRPRVALNGRFSGTAQPTGTQTAAFGLFDRIVRQNREWELVVFADGRFPGVAEWGGLQGVRMVNVPFQSWSRSRAQLWEQMVFPRLCRAWECVVEHHPINTSPAWKGAAYKIVTLHDLNFLCHPEWYSATFRLVYSCCALPGLRNADGIVTISHYVENQARTFLRVPSSRFRMIYNGSKHLKVGDAVREPPGRYVLCVGSIPPHKNLARLILAYQRVREDFPDLELRVVGRPTAQVGKDEELAALLSSPGVKVLGYLSEAELAQAYAGARVFCYPSLEEGFGLPLLEAMSLGTPVVTSHVSCLPEIAGGAAVLVDPFLVEDIAEGLRRVLRWSPEERTRQVEVGKRRAAEFSWERAAAAYLDLYREVQS